MDHPNLPIKKNNWNVKIGEANWEKYWVELVGNELFILDDPKKVWCQQQTKTKYIFNLSSAFCDRELEYFRS